MKRAATLLVALVVAAVLVAAVWNASAVVNTILAPLGGSPGHAAEPRPMTVTVPALDIEGVRAVTAPASDRRPLRHGFLHVEGTAYPWQRGNVYLAGHDLGFPGTDSWHLLWNLDTLMYPDRVILETAEGTEYVYRVYESEVIDPHETRVMTDTPTEGTPARIVTLQTCVPHFVWDQRLIVRGELIRRRNA